MDESRRAMERERRCRFAVPQSVLDAVEAREVRVVHAAGQTVGEAVDAAVEVAEGAVGRAEPLVLRGAR